MGAQGGGRSASPRKAFAEILNDMLRLSDVEKERVGGAGGRRCKALQKFGLLIDMLRLWLLWSSLSLLLLILLLLLLWLLLLWLLLLLLLLWLFLFLL